MVRKNQEIKARDVRVIGNSLARPQATIQVGSECQ
jgi:hypothetical protein